MEKSPDRQRVLTFEKAAIIFSLQLELYPELMDELARLSGGLIGVVDALMESICDEISYTPDELTTAERIRAIVGVPEDPDQLDEWRIKFWDEYYSEHG